MNAAAQTFALAFGSVFAAATIGVTLANHTADAAAAAARPDKAAHAALPDSAQIAARQGGVTEQRHRAGTVTVAQAPTRRPL